ncbi:hypothetical protein [Actinomadura madurae]|uniref:hypothetical protein n=1 Tax=Actinomadura madurae TaxID=1993 RepID=UPI0020D201AB|nr:hypothetical protein [Actinomadura madurae]MCP9979171.1 hypothetical protein [Actinomadura madurae]
MLDRPDPGGIDIRRITGPDTPLAAIPKPRVPGTAAGPRLLPPRPRTPDTVRPPQNDPPPPGRPAPLRPASEPVPVGPSAN